MKLNSNMLGTVIFGIVAIIILFSAYSTIVPTAQEAGDSLNESNRCVTVGCVYNLTKLSGDSIDCYTANGDADNSSCSAPNEVPLSSLFSGSGVVFIIIMASLIIVIVRTYIKGKK